jgi:uncharacterized protein
MSWETAKETIDYLMEHREEFPQTEIIWEFIGGEPLLEVALIEKIIDYTRVRAWQLDHPWFENAMYSFSTNGSLFHDPRFQALLKQYGNRLDVGLTLDGPEHVHNLERVYPDGSGTHAAVIKNLEAWKAFVPNPTTKVTFAHDTIPFVAESILYLFSVGIRIVNANVVFEDVWEEGDDALFEEQLNILGDAILDKELWREHEVSLFSRLVGHPVNKQTDNNWCGAGRYMMAVDAQGTFYPCVRFTDYSLAKQEPLIIGNNKEGVIPEKMAPFYELSRSSQSTQECMDCEVASGCAWCQGFNYDDSGDLFHRATHICEMHKARVRANQRFWKKLDAILEAEGAPMEKVSCDSCEPTETPCGKVSGDERDEIRGLFQRKLGLQELFQALAKMEPHVRDLMYDKALADMGDTSQKFQAWWENTAKKHNWKSINGGSWRIDFDTCEVFLVHPN